MPAAAAPTAFEPQLAAESAASAAMVVLRSANQRRCAKHFIRDANGGLTVVPYDREYAWYPEVVPLDSLFTFHQALDILSSCNDRIIVRGALSVVDMSLPLRRTSVGADARLFATPRSWVALDIDGMDIPALVAPGLTTAGRVAAVIALLPRRFHGVACWYQLTSSYGVETSLDVMRVRLWYLLSHPMTDLAWRSTLRDDARRAHIDLSLFNPVQPHFIGSPSFEGMDDPVRERTGAYDPPGARQHVDVSDVPDRLAMSAAVSDIGGTIDGVQMYPDEIAAIIASFEMRSRVSGRHCTGLALLGELMGHGMPSEDARQRVIDYMAGQGRAPDAAELTRMVTFIRQRAATGQLRTNVAPLSVVFQTTDIDELPIEVPVTPEQAAANLDVAETITAEWPAAPNTMARRAHADLFGGERYVRWLGGDYEFTGTYWRHLDPEDIEARIQRASDATPTACERAAKALRNQHHKNYLRPPCRLADGVPLPARVCAQNGWLSVERIRAPTSDPAAPTPYSAEVFDTVEPMPVPYDPAAECPRFRRFMTECFGTDAESQELLLKLMGYLLFKGNEYQRIFILSGAPSCGKSTWLRVMRALLGAQRAAVTNLAAFSEDFGLQSVYQASALFLPEAGHGDRGAQLSGEVVDQIKRISGGDPVVIHRKYEDDVTAEVMPTPVIVCNVPPLIRDEAFVRRLVSIHFPNSFLGREDPTLTGALLGELPGILNLALLGLKMLGHERDPFPPPRAPTGDSAPSPARDLYEQIRTESSPVAEFARECLVLQPDTPLLPTEEMFAVYQRWCAVQGHRAVSARMFSSSIRMALPSARPSRDMRGTQRIRGLLGVVWSPEGLRVQANQAF